MKCQIIPTKNKEIPKVDKTIMDTATSWYNLAVVYLGKQSIKRTVTDTQHKLEENNKSVELDGNFLTEPNNIENSKFILNNKAYTSTVIGVDQFMKLNVSKLDDISKKVGINIKKVKNSPLSKKVLKINLI